MTSSLGPEWWLASYWQKVKASGPGYPVTRWPSAHQTSTYTGVFQCRELRKKRKPGDELVCNACPTSLHPLCCNYPEHRNRKCLTTELSLPEWARPRAQQLTPTKTRDIFKRHAYHVAVAEDGHTPLVAKSHFGVRDYSSHCVNEIQPRGFAASCSTRQLINLWPCASG